jgi:hypothetical protein
MKLKISITIIFWFFTFTMNAQDSIFNMIQNKTWFDETGFAGESIVFFKSDSGHIQAFRQINGSGIPVVLTILHDVQIQNDTIILLSSPDNIIYIYNNQGLFSNAGKLSLLFNEPIIYVCSGKRNIPDTRINVNTLTNISFLSNEVYINDKVYKINPER